MILLHGESCNFSTTLANMAAIGKAYASRSSHERLSASTAEARGSGTGETKRGNLLNLVAKRSFYCVNTSYPMDNCFTGQRDWSRQMSEKDVLYIIPAGPVTECAFARWRIVLPCCQDNVTSSHLFCLARKSVQTFFFSDTFLKFYNELFHFILIQAVRINFASLLIIMSSPGQKQGSCGHVMAIFDNHKKCETTPVSRN